jgi:hypothetical protein
MAPGQTSARSPTDLRSLRQLGRQGREPVRADGFGGDVTEYNIILDMVFSYDAGMVNATAVTTDRFGAVYEGDGSGFINEYA